MESFVVDLKHQKVVVRALTGHDEWELHGGPGAGRELIERLLESANSNDEAAALELTAGERDRLLAALWQHYFGDTIMATRRCVDCGEFFDLNFSLSALVDSLDATPQPEEVVSLTPEGHAQLITGHTIRPATAEDENAIERLDLDEAEIALTRRCVSGGAPPPGEVLDKVLDWLDPVIDIDLDGVCPECGTAQTIRFSIEHYLTISLQRERNTLLREVHLLASAYSWPLQDILELERLERQALCAFVNAGHGTAPGEVWS